MGLAYPDYLAGMLLIIGLAAMLLARLVTFPLLGRRVSWFEKLARKHLAYKEIGWEDVGERFTRYALLKTRWGNVYLHQLYAPVWHPECHDHPWGFLTILLWRGYLERVPCPYCGGKHTLDFRRWPGMVLWRPATFTHSVTTPYGTSWSLILTGPKSNVWGFRPCNRPATPTKSYVQYIKEHSDVL